MHDPHEPDVGDELAVIFHGRAIRAKVVSIYESDFDKRRTYSIRLDRPILTALHAPGGDNLD